MYLVRLMASVGPLEVRRTVALSRQVAGSLLQRPPEGEDFAEWGRDAAGQRSDQFGQQLSSLVRTGSR